MTENKFRFAVAHRIQIIEGRLFGEGDPEVKQASSVLALNGSNIIVFLSVSHPGIIK